MTREPCAARVNGTPCGGGSVCRFKLDAAAVPAQPLCGHHADEATRIGVVVLHEGRETRIGGPA